MKKKLKYGILGNYSGKIGCIIFCKNGFVRIKKIIVKRKK